MCVTGGCLAFTLENVCGSVKTTVCVSDVVVIVGDLTDSQVTRLRTAAEPLALLRPRLGSYFATGQNQLPAG